LKGTSSACGIGLHAGGLWIGKIYQQRKLQSRILMNVENADDFCAEEIEASLLLLESISRNK